MIHKDEVFTAWIVSSHMLIWCKYMNPKNAQKKITKKSRKRGFHRPPSLKLQGFHRPPSHWVNLLHFVNPTSHDHRFNIDKFRVYRRLTVNSSVCHSGITQMEWQILQSRITRKVLVNTPSVPSQFTRVVTLCSLWWIHLCLNLICNETESSQGLAYKKRKRLE